MAPRRRFPVAEDVDHALSTLRGGGIADENGPSFLSDTPAFVQLAALLA